MRQFDRVFNVQMPERLPFTFYADGETFVVFTEAERRMAEVLIYLECMLWVGHRFVSMNRYIDSYSMEAMRVTEGVRVVRRHILTHFHAVNEEIIDV